MANRPSFDDLLDVLYLSAIDPAMRAEFLRRCAAYFDCPTLAFIVSLRPDRGVHAGVHGWSEQTQQLYHDYYALLDPWYLGYARAGVVPARPGQQFIGRGSSVVTETEIRTSEYWNDFGVKHDPDHFYQGGIVTDSVCLTMLRSPHQGDWDDSAVSEWHTLYPHFRRAFAIHERVLDLRESIAAAQSAVDALDCGLIGLDETGTVAFINQTAESILNRAQGISVRAGRILFSNTALAGRFGRWLRSAADPFRMGAGPDGITIRSKHGAVHLCLLPAVPETSYISEKAKLVILVTDPSTKPKSRELVLSALFSLTPAESRISMLLAAGLDPREISEQTHTSFETVRFHLKSAYQKTGVRRQSELVRLISQLPGI